MTPHSPEAGNGTASNQLATLRVTPVRCADEPSFELTHPYVELVYGSIIGPAAVQVARHLGHRLADETGPIEVNLAAFASTSASAPAATSPSASDPTSATPSTAWNTPTSSSGCRKTTWPSRPTSPR